jgi:hypothetical protein
MVLQRCRWLAPCTMSCVWNPQDGSPGKETFLPPVDFIQRSPIHRADFIDYSTFDAEGTWLLFQKLKQLLLERPWSLVRGTS